MTTPEDPETVSDPGVADPSKQFEASRKLPTILISRSALLPVSVAALLPLIAAGATQLPIKDLVGIAKRLLLL